MSEKAKSSSRRGAIVQAAKANDRKALLLALQSRLAGAVQDSQTPPRDLSSLSRRLMEVSRELEALEALEAKEAEDGGISLDDSPFDPSSI